MFNSKLQLLSLKRIDSIKFTSNVREGFFSSDSSFGLRINGTTVFSTREFGEGDVADLSGTKAYPFFKQVKIELFNNEQLRQTDSSSEVFVYSDKKEEEQVAVLQSKKAYYEIKYIVIHEESSSIPGVEVRDGIVFFKNTESFSQTLSLLNSIDDEELEFWEDSLDFDNSLRKGYDISFDTLEDIDLESSSKLYIPDDALATVVNENGIFVVGNEIHKITNENEYIVQNLDFDKLKQIDDSEVNLPENVTKFKIRKGIKDNTLIQTRVGEGKYTRKKSPYVDIGVKHLSAHLIAWHRTYAGYASIGVRIKGRKLKRRKWRNDKMWYASLEYTASISIQQNLLPYTTELLTGFKSRRNKKRVGKVIKFMSYIGKWYEVNFIDCKFEYHDDGYPLRVWQERWD